MNKKLLLFFSVFCIIKSFGQIGFENVYITDYTPFLKSYFFEDINNDGYKDIVSFSDGSIDWYKNTGVDGQFTRRKNIALGYGITSIGIVDFDNDGDLDLVSANSHNDKITWYENTDSQGSYSVQQFIAPSITSVGIIYIEDFDSDGDLDIIHHGGSKVKWFENTGNTNNNFTIEHTISNNISFNKIVDVDNDGDLDFYYSNQNGILWYENLGDNNFSSSKVLFNSIYNITSTTLDDIDLDGDLDIIISGTLYSPSRILILENDGFGVYGTPQIIYQVNSSLGNTFLDVMDVDNDGIKDIIVTFSNRISKLKKLNDGSYSDPIPLVSSSLTINNSKFSDIDNDGDIDIIAELNESSIGLYKNINATDNFSNISFISADTKDSRSVVSADINGDGNLDVLIAAGGKIAWYETIKGEDYFSEQKIIAFGLATAKDARASDIDGDGDLDVVSISGEGTGTGRVFWYENLDGLGTFGPQTDIIGGSYGSPDGLLVFDIDADGDNDVVTSIANGGTDKIVWYENLDGQGSFRIGQIISTEVKGLVKLVKADIDGDGDFDLISLSVLDSKIAWYENLDGLGNYGSQQIIVDNIESVFDVAVGDIDGDLDMDVVYASGTGIQVNSVFWHSNLDGRGLYGPALTVTAEIGNNGSRGVSIADLDNDGDNDVISFSRHSATTDEIIWMPNIDGLGNFDPPQVISASVPGPFSMFVTDMDNDGDADILSASAVYESVIWHKNSGVSFNLIEGAIHIDIDFDGCDSSDLGFANLLVSTSDGSNTNSLFSLEKPFEGRYQFFVEEGNYTTSITTPIFNYFKVSPVSHVSDFTGVGNIDLIDFCIEPVGVINDLNISIYPSQEDPRPGFNTHYRIVYRNVGTTQLSGDISFEYDNTKLNFLNASEAVSSQTTNLLTFNFIELKLFETRTIDVEFNVFAPPTTNIDDILVSKVTVNPVISDETEADNVFTLNQTVIGSYDPNDIRVLEGEQITLEEAENYLHYIIRFQNTGTASAINVNVENILDDRLDWTTMQLESLSHSGRVEILNGNQAKFIFNDINLQDSTNDEPNSHGFIAYKIKPKPDVIIGDIFNNTANIYFDFNPPITTNTVSTEVTSTLNTHENLISKFYVHPNPAKNIVNIQSETQISLIEIYNNLGQIVSSVLNKATIDISTLNAGLYILKIKDAFGNIEIKKMIKV